MFILFIFHSLSNRIPIVFHALEKSLTKKTFPLTEVAVKKPNPLVVEGREHASRFQTARNYKAATSVTGEIKN